LLIQEVGIIQKYQYQIIKNYKIYMENKLLIVMIGLIKNLLIWYVWNLGLLYLLKLVIKFSKGIEILGLGLLNGERKDLWFMYEFVNLDIITN
jgi:hypothetical protein